MGRETFSMPKAGSVRGRPYHVISSQLACDIRRDNRRRDFIARR
jgi:hypothetical protein